MYVTIQPTRALVDAMMELQEVRDYTSNRNFNTDIYHSEES